MFTELKNLLYLIDSGEPARLACAELETAEKAFAVMAAELEELKAGAELEELKAGALAAARAEFARQGGAAGKGRPKNQPPRIRCTCGALLGKDGTCTRCKNKAEEKAAAAELEQDRIDQQNEENKRP